MRVRRGGAMTRRRYDRAAAVRYALEYWDRVCHDGCFAVRNRADGGPAVVQAEPGSPIRAADELVPQGAGEGDCAHFASCCLGAPAGGLALGVQDAPPAYGLVSAPSLVRFLTRGRRARVLPGPDGAEVLSDPDAARRLVRDGILPGDLVAYVNATGIRHLAIFVGEGEALGTVACHSVNRCHIQFDTIRCGGWIGWTFLHVL